MVHLSTASPKVSAEVVDVDVDDLEGYLDRWSRAHGGYDVRSSRPTMTWLRTVHRLAAPLARRGVAPAWVTLTGCVLAVAVSGVAGLGGRWPLLAAVLVVVVALLDGVDGAVAEITDSASAWGRVLDPRSSISRSSNRWRAGATEPCFTKSIAR